MKEVTHEDKESLDFVLPGVAAEFVLFQVWLEENLPWVAVRPRERVLERVAAFPLTGRCLWMRH